jgi:hypothetical protein
MPFDPLTWALGYVFTTATNKITKPPANAALAAALRAAVQKWADGLPEGISATPEALYPADSKVRAKRGSLPQVS